MSLYKTIQEYWMQDCFSSLLSKLDTANTFQQGAERLLEQLKLSMTSSLNAQEVEGRLLRGMVHLRPEAEYRGLVYLEFAGNQQKAPAHLSSVTAWQSLMQYQQSLWVDVQTRHFETPSQSWTLPAVTSAPQGFATTQIALSKRDTTHLLAIPMLSLGKLRGMVTFELSIPELVGERGFVDWLGPLEVLEQLVKLGTLVLDRLPMGRPMGDTQGPWPWVGEASAACIRLTEQFASYAEPILISGETGTGKSQLAKWIHARSGRKGAFIEADIVSLSAELAGARLFGSKRGAFTGAVDQKGCVHDAQNGTLFIDEIACLSLENQVQLLRLLDQGKFKRLGGKDELSSARVVVATYADLQAEVRAGRFRSDLFYRIAVLSVQLPPLRERKDEIESWSQHFLESHQQAHLRNHHVRLSPAALVLLQAQAWPGNLRQLKGVLVGAWTFAALGSPTEVVVGEDHVRRALAISPGGMGVVVGLRQVAGALIRTNQVQAGWAAGGPIRGALILELLSLGHSLEILVEQFALQRQVQGSNYLVTLREAVFAFQELARQAGEQVQEMPAVLERRRGMGRVR